ncbi:hypothetical protein PR003_g2360 [Phytophthora rubi]|uniref:HTH CENPB-type domain-containing protein n=2 Tax=Phytophthora TaxID=4783 RepID=A0A6A3JUT6_9STRA|nr:hypothetical protein PR001_g20122 [Phytophthora rubi]KAE9045393.1 hypothetical protein PR002_g2262 [Phytophthora rubi]KAE9356363.1 hypothetical protein PR003_g2360 [Phytophthora rubi]KAE9359773.1 hypothetical protein PF008_g2108 [Phytophthora fragariae]
MDIAKDLDIPDGAFSASYTWVRSFTKRHRLSFRAKTHQGQEAPPETLEKAAVFAKDVARTVEVEGIVNIFNADQTAIFYEMLPKTTLAPTGSKTLWVKCGKKEKERMTAMVMGDIRGNKYRLFLMMKSKPSKLPAMASENHRYRHSFGRRVWKEVKDLQERFGAQIYGNSNAWWTGDLTLELLRFHFGHRTPFDDPVLLLLDDFSGHWIDEAEEYARTLRVVLMKVPPGLTWLCQPADAVWIKPLKDRLRKEWVAHLQEQLARHQADPAKPFRLEPPKRATVTEWVSTAWGSISADVIKTGFRKCRISAESASAVEATTEEDMQDQINEVLSELEALDLIEGAVHMQEDVVDRLSEGRQEGSDAE